MTNLKTFLCCLAILTSCNSTRMASDFFGRQKIKTCLTAFEPGFMFCNGIKKQIPPRLEIPEDVENQNYIIDYYSDKEFRLYICLRFEECQ